MNLSPLPDLMLEPLVRAALLEDLGRAGDITADAIIPAAQTWRAALVARQAGVVAGLDLARLAFRLIDPAITFTAAVPDGTTATPGMHLANVEGPARGIVTAERVALNFLCRLSGIANATHQLVTAIRPHAARICCTRKTTPGLRLIEKYAVRAGGGANHRFGLDDAMLIKDNHIAVAGGVGAAIERGLDHAGHLVKIEVEVDTLDQLREALAFPIHAVLLDNMKVATLAQAVASIRAEGQGPVIAEASGGVTLASVNAIAATGVDIISAGWLTHSAPILDIGLDDL